MSIILGIASSHDASACILRDGVLVAAVSEERMSRIKCDGGRLPQLAIDECLRMAGLTRHDVDFIAANYDHVAERYCKRYKESSLKRVERALSAGIKRLRGVASAKQVFLRRIQNDLRHAASDLRPEDFFMQDKFLAGEGFRADAEVHFIDHHRSHAAAAAYYSGFDHCAVITMDGEGDLDIHFTAGTYADGRLTTSRIGDRLGDSPGYFYMDITELLGFRPLRHEGKVLGLAAFGDPALLAPAFRKALRAAPDGLGFDSDFGGAPHALARRRAFLEQVIVGHSRENVAAAAQAVFEEAIVAICRNHLRASGERRLAVNGGVFANVKLNQRIAALAECDSLFVFPGMSDTGNSVGAALLLQDRLQPGFLRSPGPLDHVYWGSEPTRAEIEVELLRRGLRYEEVGLAGVVERTAQAIHAGQVVGWFQGAMEFGPRALGNRSMVAAPVDKSINDWFNARLERSEFMPFAPSALAEYADEVFENVGPGRHAAEFMTITFDVKKDWQARIPAVVHVDGTARPQLVRRDRNPRYWALIERYRQLSGIPLLLNTSFNVHEEPIVRGAQEAVQALVDRRIDHLAIGDFWVPGVAESR